MSFFTKHERALQFRNRLADAMQRRDINQSALARAVDVDRSTISQLLSGSAARLPNGHLIGECASALGVSADWLLGLTERPESAADLMATNLSMTEAPRALIDEQIYAWHREAAGYKIRHVPAAMPDIIKTHAMLQWEYEPHLGRTTEQAIGASEDRLSWMRGSRSDYEIALSVHEVESFARGEGYYRDLPAQTRRDQIDRMLALHEQLYPTLRIYLFDARRLFSSPITIFGPLLAVLYVGRYYVGFRDRERVQGFTVHFDQLVRETTVSDRDLPAFLAELRAEMP